MMNENMPNEKESEMLSIVMAMHRIPRTVRDESIAEADNVIDLRPALLRRSKLQQYLENDCG